MDFSKLTGTVPTDGETEFFHPIGKFIGEDKKKPTAEILEQISIPVLPKEAESIFASEPGELFTIKAELVAGKNYLMLQYILNHPGENVYICTTDFLMKPCDIADKLSSLMFDTVSTDRLEEIRKYASYIISSLPIYINDPDPDDFADKMFADLNNVGNGRIFIYDVDELFAFVKRNGPMRAKVFSAIIKHISEKNPVTVFDYDYCFNQLPPNSDRAEWNLIKASDKITEITADEIHNFPYAKEKLSVADIKFSIVKSSYDDEGTEFFLWEKFYKNRALIPREPLRSVFIGGSKSIDFLDKNAIRKIDGYAGDNVRILIGDCPGVDKLVQAHLFLKGYKNVTVYATDGNARNNIGDWPVVNVPSHGEQGYEYYQLKDIEMAKDADEAFMIWDGQSRGTAFNIDEMQKLEKRVYIHQQDNKDRNQHNGVFWFIDDKLYAFPYDENKYRDAVSKSGTSYNHQKIWEYIRPKGCANKPFDYYPRGRVVIIRLNRPVIYMNPKISEKYVPEIMEAFNIQKDPIIRYDYSEHYKCYLDE